MASNLGQPNYNVFNPPDYWTQMITDPTQVPVQLYPYGGGGYSPYGPYPGFYFGQRPMTYEDAMRHAHEREEFEQRRADVTEDPTYKYINPEGRLKGPAGAVVQALKVKEQTQKQQGPDIVGGLQKKILLTVLIGAVLSALFK